MVAIPRVGPSGRVDNADKNGGLPSHYDARALLALNRETCANWESFASHRRRVTDLIVDSCGAGVDRVQLLGAGNCNDVDLPCILRRTRRVDLLDFDREAVHRGVERQGIAGNGAVALHVDIDVTDAMSELQRGAKQRAEDAVKAYRSKLEHVPRLPGQGCCDVVVSCCLLTALISSIVDNFGAEHPNTASLAAAVRDQHLRVLAAQAKPGGDVLLVTDLVSSDTYPRLVDAPSDSLRALMLQAIAVRNFFTGTNPFAVIERVRALLHDSVDAVRFISPWRWQISAERAYLVYAIAFSRRRASGQDSVEGSPTEPHVIAK